MRSLLPNEQLEERDGYTIATDIGPDGARYVKFWVDAAPDSHHEEADFLQMFEGQNITDLMYSRRAPPAAEMPMFGDQCPSPEEPSHPMLHVFLRAPLCLT